MHDLLQGAATVHRITVDEYLRMEDVLPPDGHFELVDGEIVEMSPRGQPHSLASAHVNRLILTRLVAAGLDRDFILFVDLTLALDEFNAREPDLALARGRGSAEARTTPADIVLIVEVSHTTLAYDRGDKAHRYARAGIPEYWIVSVPDRAIEIRRDPEGGAYQSVEVLDGAQPVRSRLCEAIEFTPNDVFEV